tara:strand:+ start:210 stop:890 length:681 start_codon:yes stop_codon:yes gene_type:complete
MRYDFNSIKKHYFNQSEISISSGNKFDLIQRINLSDNVNGDNLTFDNQSSKIFKTPNNLILLKGSVEYKQYWNEGDIQSTDIERYKYLTNNDKIKLGSFSQTSTTDAITNNEIITTYNFGVDYDEFSPKANAWTLATKTDIMAQEDDTRLFCFISDNPYDLKIIDIDVGQTKTINKSDGDNYLLFSANCSMASSNIEENDLRKLSSISVSIKNESDRPARIIKLII